MCGKKYQYLEGVIGLWIQQMNEVIKILGEHVNREEIPYVGEKSVRLDNLAGEYIVYAPLPDFLTIYKHTHRIGIIEIGNEYGSEVIDMDLITARDDIIMILDYFDVLGLHIEYYAENTPKDFNDYLLLGIIKLLDKDFNPFNRLRETLLDLDMEYLYPKFACSCLGRNVSHVREMMILD